MEHMKSKQIDQLIVSSPASLFYLTGHWVHPGKRFLALLLTSEGTCTYFANELFHLNESISCPVVRYSDNQDPLNFLMQHLADRATIGVDNSLCANLLLGMLQRLHHAKVVFAAECVDLVRMVKDAEEICLLRESSRINDLTMADIISTIHPNFTELELAHRLPELYCSHGGDGYAVVPIVSYGPNCADAHHRPDSTRLSKGDSIVLDMGIPYQSYCSDMTRTVFYGDISDEFERIYHIVLKAQLAACEAIKPGMRCCDIDAVARGIITEEGYGPYFTHRTGHNIGIEGHEFPSIGIGNEMPLQAGMVFSVEPGIYLPKQGGVRIEDLVVVTDDGCEILNHYTKELQIISE